MEHIKYEQLDIEKGSWDPPVCLTECPHVVGTMVGSSACENCDYNVGTHRRERYVECLYKDGFEKVNYHTLALRAYPLQRGGIKAVDIKPPYRGTGSRTLKAHSWEELYKKLEGIREHLAEESRREYDILCYDMDFRRMCTEFSGVIATGETPEGATAFLNSKWAGVNVGKWITADGWGRVYRQLEALAAEVDKEPDYKESVRKYQGVLSMEEKETDSPCKIRLEKNIQADSWEHMLDKLKELDRVKEFKNG